MSKKALFFLATVSSCFARNYDCQSYSLRATKEACCRICRHQKEIRTLDFSEGPQKALVLRLLEKEQGLLDMAFLDISRLDTTLDVKVKKSFNLFLFSISGLIDNLYNVILHEGGDDLFFSDSQDLLSFCQEVYLSKLSCWSENADARYINKSLIRLLEQTIDQLQKTVVFVSDLYAQKKLLNPS